MIGITIYMCIGMVIMGIGLKDAMDDFEQKLGINIVDCIVRNKKFLLICIPCWGVTMLFWPVCFIYGLIKGLRED